MQNGVSSIFKKGRFYYFKAFENGKRKTFSTHCNDEFEALKYIAKWHREQVNCNPSVAMDLALVLSLWTDPECNPKKLYCQNVGEPYSDRHAKHIAAQITWVIDVVKDMPIYNQNVNDLTRAQCKGLFDRIIELHGRTNHSLAMIKAFKSIISWMYKNGEIEMNPSQQLKNVKPENRTFRLAITRNDMIKILSMDGVWKSEEIFDFFRLLAYTGLRMGECAALDQSKQIRIDSNGRKILSVDRAFKDESWKTIGKPKFEISRVIPLSKGASDILERRPKQGLCFPNLSKQKLKMAVSHARSLFMNEEWEFPQAVECFSAHICRHTLNTNLLDFDCSRTLVSEYLSWTHQEDVQTGYTHFIAKHLYKIADAIDEIYEYPPKTQS